ncbi:MAG: glutamyl-tRNA reductase [Kiritimatiellia bacterium]
MHFFVAGLSFKTAPVALREQLAVAPKDQAAAGKSLREAGGLGEVVLLWTCNRVEIYGTSHLVNGSLKALLQLLTAEPLHMDLDTQAYSHTGEQAVEHLFKVTSGLDSMVLGEPEITGQIKTAYETARQAGLTGSTVNRIFQKALQTAKAIRSGTEIGQGAASVGSVCVLRAETIFGSRLADKTVMVLGAGKMAETCVRHFWKKGARSIIVANRTYDRAVELAGQFSGEAVHFDRFHDAMRRADIVVTSTGCPVTVLHPEDLEPVMQAREGRPLFIIDIAVPRDVDPRVAGMPNVFLDDIDDLQETVRQNVRHRQQDIVRCQEILREKLDELAADEENRRQAEQRAFRPAATRNPRVVEAVPAGC